jgi:hypothetical protein
VDVISEKENQIMANWHDYYRLGAAQALAVASAGGATNSSTVFGSMTRAIRLVWNGATGSTSGIRYAIVDSQTPAISSTTAALLPANFIEVVKVSPGQRVSGYQQRCRHALHQHHRTD